MDNIKNSIIFTRIVVICLIIFIIFIITYSFLSVEPKGSISASMITLVILLVVIVLSERFDKFSVGKLLTMTREINSKNISIEKLDKQNTELRSELINIITSISQNQSNTNIIGYPNDFTNKMSIAKATDEEINEKNGEENKKTPDNIISSSRQRVDFNKIEEVVLKDFLAQHNLSEYNLIKEAKLVTQFNGIDEISNIQPIYDGYINTGKNEIFIEIKVFRVILDQMLRDKIYFMLNKIYLYNKIKNANAQLNLILVHLNNEERDKRSIDRIKEYFEPAIIKGLLKITEFKNKDEI